MHNSADPRSSHQGILMKQIANYPLFSRYDFPWFVLFPRHNSTASLKNRHLLLLVQFGNDVHFNSFYWAAHIYLCRTYVALCCLDYSQFQLRRNSISFAAHKRISILIRTSWDHALNTQRWLKKTSYENTKWAVTYIYCDCRKCILTITWAVCNYLLAGNYLWFSKWFNSGAQMR